MSTLATKRARATVLALSATYVASFLAFQAICLVFVIKVVTGFVSWIGIHGIADMLTRGPLTTLSVCLVASGSALVACVASNGLSRQMNAMLKRLSASSIAHLQETES